MTDNNTSITRRTFLQLRLANTALLWGADEVVAQQQFPIDAAAHHRWIEAAFEMKRRAESWGDQADGAVIVVDGKLIGEGPSRVTLLGDGNAHAEREANRNAQQRVGRNDLSGAILYSTSQPCGRRELVTAEANIARRIIHGKDLRDPGKPQG